MQNWSLSWHQHGIMNRHHRYPAASGSRGNCGNSIPVVSTEVIIYINIMINIENVDLVLKIKIMEHSFDYHIEILFCFLQFSIPCDDICAMLPYLVVLICCCTKCASWLMWKFLQHYFLSKLIGQKNVDVTTFVWTFDNMYGWWNLIILSFWYCIKNCHSK